MAARLLIAISVFLVARPLVAANESAPKIVILSYGRLGGGTDFNESDFIFDSDYQEAVQYFRRKDTAVQLDRFVGPLNDCGIEPILLDDIPPEKLADALAALHLPTGSIILINSHGSIGEGLYEVGSDHSPMGWLAGDDVVRRIVKSVPSPRIWLGTCHADACKVEYSCLGGECRADQTSAATMNAFQQVSRLICDSYRGDCSLWRQADLDHNGRIDAKELDAFFVHEANGPMEIKSTLEATDESELGDERKEFEDQCKGLEGTMETAEIQKKPDPSKKADKLTQSAICHLTRRPFFSAPDRADKMDAYYDAAPRTFYLDSDRCREK